MLSRCDNLRRILSPILMSRRLKAKLAHCVDEIRLLDRFGQRRCKQIACHIHIVAAVGTNSNNGHAAVLVCRALDVPRSIFTVHWYRNIHEDTGRTLIGIYSPVGMCKSIRMQSNSIQHNNQHISPRRAGKTH